MTWKSKITQMFCAHDWQLWSFSLTKAESICRKCDSIRDAEIHWSKPRPMFPEIKLPDEE